MKPVEEIIKLRGEVEAAIKHGDDAILSANKIHEKINTTIMEKISEVKEEISDIKVQIAELPEKLAEKFDERYANKNTEIAVNRLMWIVITAVVGALLSLIFIEF